MLPEQRRVQAGSTVILPCYAVASSHSAVDATTNYFRALHRRRRTALSRDSTNRKLRHSGRASRLRRRQSSGRWMFKWRRNDEPIVASASGKFLVDTLDHSLTIRNVSSAVDTAMYSCTRQRRSHDNGANSSKTDDVITSRHIQLVVEGIVVRYHVIVT